MQTIVKNEKGLFASPSSSSVDGSKFDALRKAAAGKPELLDWLAGFEAACLRNEWGSGKHRRSALMLSNTLGGLGNETATWDIAAMDLRAWWDRLEELRSSLPAALGSWKPDGGFASEGLDEIDAALPKKAAVARAKAMVLEELEAGWEAKGGQAWAIWMGSPREQGYMDDKKRPAGAAGARLFESAAAAMRTAKAAKFGGERGPAAIVRLRVECVKIESSEPGSPCAAVRSHMARREALEIQESLEEASIDDIRRALGEPVADGAPAAEAPAEGSLAGREEGYACWIEGQAGSWREDSGFVNIRGAVGPLTGAVLKPTVKGAQQKGWSGQSSIVRVACWPVAIDDLVGEPIVASLSCAIAWEQEQAASDALRKQDAQTLKARAQALESGQAAPRRRARSL